MFIENRKEEEAKFHNKIRDEKLTGNKKEYNKLTSNKKFYSITRKSQNYRNNLLIENCQGKKILDFCCGNGDLAIFLAEQDTDVYGIDISTTSIENAKRKATEKRITNIHFLVMDAENMTFENDYFDLIVCNGVLHHLDIKKVYPELARVLKSN